MVMGGSIYIVYRVDEVHLEMLYTLDWVLRFFMCMIFDALENLLTKNNIY